MNTKDDGAASVSGEPERMNLASGVGGDAKDAARYRWLRDHDSILTGVGIYFVAEMTRFDLGEIPAAEVDAFLDRQMAEFDRARAKEDKARNVSAPEPPK